MDLLSKGRYRARLAAGEGDVARAQGLRHLAFRAARGLICEGGRDADEWDKRADHVLVEEDSGALVACFRLMLLPGGAALGQSYAAARYDLSGLACQPGPMAEMGRFCLHPGQHDPDILRLAWGAATVLIDRAGVGFLFGCMSFPGADPARHRPALAHLAARHLAPPDWRPGAGANVETLRLDDAGPAPDPRTGLSALPPLMRSYLAMGARVGAQAVIDRDLDTLHVFTGLDVARVPAARARALRAVAAI